MNLVEKIEKLLSDRGWKQIDLAEAIGVSKQRVSQWMQGTGQPKPYHLLRMARALNVPMEFLADDTMEDIAAQGVSAEEMKVVEMARVLGLEEAKRRLLQAPAVDIEFIGHGRYPEAIRQQREQQSRSRKVNG